MSMEPESYTDKPRKVAHDIFKGIAIVSGGLALLGFLAGGTFALSLIVCVGSAYVSSKIRYTWAKRVHVTATGKRFELV